VPGSALVIFLLLQKIVEGEAVTVGGVSMRLVVLLLLQLMLFLLQRCQTSIVLAVAALFSRDEREEAVIVGGVSMLLPQLVLSLFHVV
jgi:hypothetical protein